MSDSSIAENKYDGHDEHRRFLSQMFAGDKCMSDVINGDDEMLDSAWQFSCCVRTNCVEIYMEDIAFLASLFFAPDAVHIGSPASWLLSEIWRGAYEAGAEAAIKDGRMPQGLPEWFTLPDAASRFVSATDYHI